MKHFIASDICDKLLWFWFLVGFSFWTLSSHCSKDIIRFSQQILRPEKFLCLKLILFIAMSNKYKSKLGSLKCFWLIFLKYNCYLIELDIKVLSVQRYLCCKFGRFSIKIYIPVKIMQLNSMKGNISKVSSLTYFLFFNRK